MSETTSRTKRETSKKALAHLVAPAMLALALTLGVTSPAAATILTFEVFYKSLADQPGGPDLDYDNPLIPPTEPGYGYYEGFRIPPTYGDNVVSTSITDPPPPAVNPDGLFRYGVGAEGFTPDVTASYGPFSIFNSGPELWRGDYGDLNGVLYQGSFPSAIGYEYNVLDIVLTAAPGFDVQLHGFDLGSHTTARTINSVSVHDGVPSPFLTPDPGELYNSALNIVVPGLGSHLPFTFATPLQGPTIWIRIDANNLAGPDNDSRWVGIDNIRFGQVINETSLGGLSPEEIDAAFQSSEVPEPASLVLMLVGGAGAALERVRRRRRNG